MAVSLPPMVSRRVSLCKNLTDDTWLLWPLVSENRAWEKNRVSMMIQRRTRMPTTEKDDQHSPSIDTPGKRRSSPDPFRLRTREGRNHWLWNTSWRRPRLTRRPIRLKTRRRAGRSALPIPRLASATAAPPDDKDRRSLVLKKEKTVFVAVSYRRSKVLVKEIRF